MFVSLSNVPGLWLTLGIMTLILVGMGILSPWRKPNNNRIYLPPIALITGVLYTLLTIGWGIGVPRYAHANELLTASNRC
jgi:uncharacterized membrane protein YfcA